MGEISIYVGQQIRKYRKAGKMTIQQLADAIHKSRATVCKYENGEISLDVETLYEISQVLQISVSQLISYAEPQGEEVLPGWIWTEKSLLSGKTAVFLFLRRTL